MFLDFWVDLDQARSAAPFRGHRHEVPCCNTLFVSAAVAQAAPLSSREKYLIDGDTAVVGSDRFRLVGYDTPETYKPRCGFKTSNILSADFKTLYDPVERAPDAKSSAADFRA